jgi:hypothetical protein
MTAHEESPLVPPSVLIPLLSRNRKSLMQRGEGGELLVIDDLFVDVPRIAQTTAIFCLDSDVADSESAESAPTDISPGLSFLWTSGGIDKFSSADKLSKRLTDFRASRPSRRMIGQFTYEYYPHDEKTLELVNTLAQAVDVLFRFSLNRVNKSEDLIDSVSRRLLNRVEELQGRFGLPDLVRFLENETTLQFSLIHLTRAPAVGTAMITVSKASSKESSLESLSLFLGMPTHTFSLTHHRVDDPFPAVPLPQTLESELIVNAGKWGKSLATSMPSNPKLRVLILPISRPFGPRTVREEPSSLAAQDVLITVTTQVTRPLLDTLRACINTFSQHRYGARRFSLLRQLQQDPTFDRTHSPLRIGPTLPSLAQQAMKDALIPLLNEVLYTTSAHSVSVRLYDPASKALVSEAVVESEVAAFAPSDPIPLKNNTRTSVTAFLFLNAGPTLQHVYLRRISQPIFRESKGRVKRHARTFIPEEYKVLGLEAPLITRDLTRSEICFALMKGRLAFGTLNLEAPYPAAFDSDISYLNLVKLGIEKLYDSAESGIDERWLIANAARSDAVHQLWQYQEGTSFFTSEQNAVLRSIFPQRSNLAIRGATPLSSLRTRVLDWAKQRWNGELQSAVIAMIKFDHLEDRFVDATFLEASAVILRNIVQNAVKHGEPKTDLLFVDDRPWFGTRIAPCLRVHYRSSNSAPDDVVRSLGVAPIQQKLGTRTAYGMYNVGLLTRLLGGSLYVTSQGPANMLTIELHLPITEQHP